MANMVSVVPIVFFTSSSSSIPVYFPTNIVLPSVRPVIRLVMIWVTWVPVETAATLSGPQYLPMTSKSTAPYSACMILAMMNGTEKVNNTRITLPFVRLFSAFFFLDSIILSPHYVITYFQNKLNPPVTGGSIPFYFFLFFLNHFRYRQEFQASVFPCRSLIKPYRSSIIHIRVHIKTGE